jgi:peptidoglycan/xylan/chitin deacetylase (PgdA/CDA1 family)
MTKVTTSWDDGDVLDLRVAELLEKYGLTGTFYITETYREKRLSEAEIRKISEGHEIGAHTLTHPNLKKISSEEKRREIAGGKAWLEQIIGKNVDMFCYPSGRYDEEAAMIAKESGFRGARTTHMASVDTGSAYEMLTTLSVYPMPFRKKGPNAFYWRRLLEPLVQRGPSFQKLGVSPWAMRSFEALGKAAFDIAKERDGVFHLWGHSWEVEQYDLWDELEAVFAYVGNRSDCIYVTNGDLL